MGSGILACLLPILALAIAEEFVEFVPEVHSKNRYNMFEIPGNKIFFEHGRPVCPFKERTPEIEEKLRFANHIRIRAPRSCRNYWVCDTTGAVSLHTCHSMDVFDPRIAECIYYKYAESPCNQEYIGMPEELHKEAEEEHQKKMLERAKNGFIPLHRPKRTPFYSELPAAMTQAFDPNSNDMKHFLIGPAPEVKNNRVICRSYNDWALTKKYGHARLPLFGNHDRYPHPEDCRKFVVCQFLSWRETEGFFQSCDPGKAFLPSQVNFNGEIVPGTGVCVDAYKVPGCENLSNIRGLSDGSLFPGLTDEEVMRKFSVNGTFRREIFDIFASIHETNDLKLKQIEDWARVRNLLSKVHSVDDTHAYDTKHEVEVTEDPTVLFELGNLPDLPSFSEMYSAVKQGADSVKDLPAGLFRVSPAVEKEAAKDDPVEISKTLFDESEEKEDINEEARSDSQNPDEEVLDKDFKPAESEEETSDDDVVQDQSVEVAEAVATPDVADRKESEEGNPDQPSAQEVASKEESEELAPEDRVDHHSTSEASTTVAEPRLKSDSDSADDTISDPIQDADALDKTDTLQEAEAEAATENKLFN